MIQPPIIDITDFFDSNEGIRVFIKREDLIHPVISGNKYRKLKYNLLEAKQIPKEKLLTFGGAYSNHIAAVAAAGKESGFSTIGVIRGGELAEQERNHTLRFAESCGMYLHFVSREEYRLKESTAFRKRLQERFGAFYLIPEGGTNTLAVKGCEEILSKEDTSFDIICVPVGTGGTMAGIVNTTKPRQKVIGFSALKGNFLNTEIQKWTSRTNWEITDAYCLGGYAKINKELIHFINTFKKHTEIPLDPVYTGKMLYGISQRIKTKTISKNSRILAIHTGGLQGIAGMNNKLHQQNLPLIDV